MNLDCQSAAARGLRRYVRLVADALEPAVDRTAVHWIHPVRAEIALSGRLHWFPGRPVALTWDERDGWAIVLARCTTGSLTVLRYLGHDILPAPQAVATFSGKVFGDQFAGQYEPPRWGRPDDLTERLAGYAAPCRPRHRGEPPVHLYGVITSCRDPA
jgi:hypothetical protein